MVQAKKIFLKLLLMIPILGMVVIVNIFVDPAHLYIKNRTFTEGVATLLASGHNVGNVVNSDKRLIQKFFIAKEKNCQR